MRRAAIVAPVRTPMGTFGGAIKALSAADLATTVPGVGRGAQAEEISR
jgi:acetyl-CoA C-acetyltransferase